MEQRFKHYAFISYSSEDTKWGKRLHRKLEEYKIPSTLRRKRGWKRKPMRPVFFAPTDIQPGDLSEELKKRLRESRNLIVICSPHSAQSGWVGKEIAYFHSLGRAANIHFFIIDGRPHSGDKETECFHPVIGELGMPETLGANIHEKNHRWPWVNKERAYMQLISKLLGVEFDFIWQRHKRRMVEHAVAWALGFVAVVAALIGVWVMNQPVDVTMGLNETSMHNVQLPPLKDAVVTMTLDNETKTDTIESIADEALFTNVPHRFIGKDVRVTVTCRDFLTTDTTLTLSESVTLNVRRDSSVYGDIRFCLWDSVKETTVGGCVVEIEGQKATSDADGRVVLSIPLAAQKPAYYVSASIPLADDTLYMPCGENDVITVE